MGRGDPHGHRGRRRDRGDRVQVGRRSRDVGRDGARPARHHRDRRPRPDHRRRLRRRGSGARCRHRLSRHGVRLRVVLRGAGAELQRVRQLDAGPRLPRRDARRRAHRVGHDRRRRGDADPRGQPHRQRLRDGRCRDQRRRHRQRLVHQRFLRPGHRGRRGRGADRPGRRRPVRRARRCHRDRRRERPAGDRDDGRPAGAGPRQRRHVARLGHASRPSRRSSSRSPMARTKRRTWPSTRS